MLATRTCADADRRLGVTGYIGGDALYAIAHAHPEYEWTCLVRNSDKGVLVAKDYPSVKLVYGDLDSHDLIAEEAAKADVVCSKFILSFCFLKLVVEFFHTLFCDRVQLSQLSSGSSDADWPIFDPIS